MVFSTHAGKFQCDIILKKTGHRINPFSNESEITRASKYFKLDLDFNNFNLTMYIKNIFCHILLIMYAVLHLFAILKLKENKCGSLLTKLMKIYVMVLKRNTERVKI